MAAKLSILIGTLKNSSPLLKLYSKYRSFNTSSARLRSLKPISGLDLNHLRVNKDRLMTDLHHTCQWGTGERWGKSPTETGMCRLALSDNDQHARDWFVETTRSLGCTVTVDQMGNVFAVRAGKKEGPPTAAGSHLDTQPTGGRYDGILGVHAGVEMLKVLEAEQLETEYPVAVVNWTNEEGARFPVSMVSSGVWAGKIPLQKAYSVADVDGSGATQRSELERIGYMGTIPASHEHNPLAAHFELHIEQGPILESGGRKIGVVHGVQAYKWFVVEVEGRACHTGTTPFSNRADALLAASRMIVESHAIATRHGGLASTGVLTIPSSSFNVVPGKVTFSLDIRSPKDEIVAAMEAEIRTVFETIASGTAEAQIELTPGTPCQVKITTFTESPAVNFHQDCIDCINSAAEGALGSKAEQFVQKQMTSGAGHDSAYTSYICPTAMIFIPCKDGISHNPKEYSSPEDCAIGAQVLMGSVLRYDRLRAEREVSE